MKYILIYLVKFYQIAISPWLGSHCRYQPSCSSYTIEALEKHGFLRGGMMAFKRIVSCHPGADGGYDPVPETSESRQDNKP